MAGNEGYPKARVAAMKALEMDDMLAEVHVSLAIRQFPLRIELVER